MPIGGIHLIFLILALAVSFYVFYPQIENFFVFYPDRNFESLPQDLGLACKDVSFETRDKISLHGWFFPLDGDAPVILFCHGNAGNISRPLVWYWGRQK